jgi:hypothetical protein
MHIFEREAVSKELFSEPEVQLQNEKKTIK